MRVIHHLQQHRIWKKLFYLFSWQIFCNQDLKNSASYDTICVCLGRHLFRWNLAYANLHQMAHTRHKHKFLKSFGWTTVAWSLETFQALCLELNKLTIIVIGLGHPSATEASTPAQILKGVSSWLLELTTATFSSEVQPWACSQLVSHTVMLMTS